MCTSLGWEGNRLVVQRTGDPWGILEKFLDRYVLPRFSKVGFSEIAFFPKTEVGSVELENGLKE